jgi:hypothetical protein
MKMKNNVAALKMILISSYLIRMAMTKRLQLKRMREQMKVKVTTKLTLKRAKTKKKPKKKPKARKKR